MNYNNNLKDNDKSYDNNQIGLEFPNNDSDLVKNGIIEDRKQIKEPLLKIDNEEIKKKKKGIKYKSSNIKKTYYRVNINSKENPSYTNRISTSLYTWYNCFPKILIEQFKKTANIYFLIIALMQSINEITISGTKPVILLPLAIVILINGCKIFFEDHKRKASDEEENNKSCIFYNKENGKFETINWKNIKVGNILKIHENEEFPADLILLSSSDINGICYIETKNLDGETNLKLKKAKIEISKFFDQESKITEFSNFIVLCNHPDNNIHEFQGFIKLNNNSYSNLNNNNLKQSKTNLKRENLEPEEKDLSINNESFLLRGCSLKLTKCVYGVVIYTGANTKIMNNSPTSRLKTSRVEEIMNFQIIIIFLFQLLLALIGSISYLILKNTQIETLSNYIFIDNGNISTFTNIFGNLTARIGTWILIFTNFVPISLLVTMEIVKYIQAMFISWDINLYDKESDNFAKVQSSTLNEELGQVKYIFSDKTGTLTKNQMLFKYVAIEENIYGMKDEKDYDSTLKINSFENSYYNSNKNENEEISTKKKKYEDKFGEITNVDFNDDCLINKLNRISLKNKNIDLFFKALSLCHSVIAHNQNSTQLNYFASSLDEKAIVNGCRYLNYIYMNKNSKNEITLKINEEDQIFTLLYTLDFDSERKRMSVIVKDFNGKVYLFMKGADDVLRALTNLNPEYICRNKNQNYLFSTKGLRTLNVAYKEIDLEEFHKWEKEYKETFLYDNTQLKKELVNKIENNIYLLGIVAIEDALQDHVTEALDVFIKTGIKVWMLTGDQKLTAESIAMSCKLITEEFHVNRLSDNIDESRIQEEFEEAISFYENKRQVKQSLIIGSNSINIVLNSRLLTQKVY